jgi:signal transduction histidine kinase
MLVNNNPILSAITNIPELISRSIFKKRYDNEITLKKSGEIMNLLSDMDRLVVLTTRIVAKRMGIANAATLIIDETTHDYSVKAAEGKSRDLMGQTFTQDLGLFRYINKDRNPLVKGILEQGISDEMNRLNAEVCVPCFSKGRYIGNKLVGIFCFGEKSSGDAYDKDDLQLFSMLSSQAAVAIENAIMYNAIVKQYKELKETKDQLVQSEKLAALGTMAAGIAHEIRNPLTSLQLFVQMMAERFDDHEFRQKFSQVVPPEIERLNRIVNDLVSFAKPSKMTMEPAQINEVLEKTIRLSEISFKKFNVKVVKDLGPVPPVLCDQQKMMQIFLNLIMNGAQAMANGGTLTVKTYVDIAASKVAIDITDTGSGITPENLKKLFSPFFTTKDAGTGLGLAITRRIVEEHNGEIKIRSKVGEGTTFTVELPAAI